MTTERSDGAVELEDKQKKHLPLWQETILLLVVALGLAILIDVLIVRMLIAPAVVSLLGDRAWWLPGWLDKLLPNVSLEGHLVENVDEREPALEERVKTPA